MEFDNFYTNKEERLRSCLLALRRIIRNQNTRITETRKWGMPCFCYRNKMFCFLWNDKHTGEPYILMVEGKRLNHPELEAGNRSRMKIFRVDPKADIAIKTIESLLEAALDLYRN